MGQDHRRFGCFAELVPHDVNPADRVGRDLSEEREALDVDCGWLGRAQLGLQQCRNLLLSPTMREPIADIESGNEQPDNEDDDQYADQRRAP